MDYQSCRNVTSSLPPSGRTSAAGRKHRFGLVTGNEIARTLFACYQKDSAEILISQGAERIRAVSRLAEFL